MYARVTTAQIQAGKTDEFAELIREAILPVAQQQHGFGGMLLLMDPNANKGIAITMWETEADMTAGEAPDGYYTQHLMKGSAIFCWPTDQGSI